MVDVVVHFGQAADRGEILAMHGATGTAVGGAAGLSLSHTQDRVF